MAHSFEEIISLENLCLAWQEFIVGKKNKSDVQFFAYRLMDNIVSLHEELANKTYKHGGYISFYITDPKPRHIHKASVKDRLLHHAVYRILYPFFDRTFISDSYSCRTNKGLHKAINHFRQMVRRVSQNNTKTCWALKCDIQKFFASIDHQILFQILRERIPDENIIQLLNEIISSFSSIPGQSIGLPLDNLTSQLFANIYMNRFDQWMKHRLAVETPRHNIGASLHYIRYADDFVILSREKKWLESIVPALQNFLQTNLRLSLHPHKIFLKTIASGVDFLGWVNFPRYRILRRTTKQRMFARVRDNPAPETLQSYLGLLSHGNTFGVKQKLLEWWWVWR